MKRLIILALLLWAMSSAAQYGDACKTERFYRIHLTQIDSFGLLVSPSHTQIYEAYGVYAFVPLDNEWVELRSLNYEPRHIQMIFFADIPDCSSAITAPLQIPMNECLGIAPSAVNLPESGFFMVDGIDYAYNGNLSFLVTLDSYWQWDLWHEGNYVLSFVQDEDMPCQIIESETP